MSAMGRSTEVSAGDSIWANIPPSKPTTVAAGHARFEAVIPVGFGREFKTRRVQGLDKPRLTFPRRNDLRRSADDGDSGMPQLDQVTSGLGGACTLVIDQRRGVTVEMDRRQGARGNTGLPQTLGQARETGRRGHHHEAVDT